MAAPETVSSYRKGVTEPPLLDATIGDCLQQTAQQYPGHEALVVRHQGIRWTYREYLERIDALATGLLALGIGPGERVGIWAPNCVEWCLTQFATARIGAIMVCINPAYRLTELEFALANVGCRALVLADAFKSSDYLAMLQEIAPELSTCEPGALSAERVPLLDTVIRTGTGSTPGMFNFDAVCAMGTQDEYERLQDITSALNPGQPVNIQFTSGTTGTPKGATLTHRNILNNGYQVGEAQRFTDRDRICIPVPLYHCFGMVMGNLAAISHGATAVFPADAFEPGAVLETVEQERCTALYGVPTMFIACLEDAEFGRYDLTSLRTGIMAGAPCPEPIMRRVIDQMHMHEVTIMYGQTETSPVNHMTDIADSLDKRVGTVGRCGPHQEIKIIDAEGAVVPCGTTGELCCRGYSVMQGYWGDEARTRETIDAEGWLHSGDLAVMDDEGYVQIVGRIKDMIIRGGENIYPREIEEFLYSHPAIQEVAVFGVDDEKYGEAVCAWIQLAEGCALDADAVQAFCRDAIAHFKVPRYVEFVDAFPMTVTGKLQKFLMSQEMNRRLAGGDRTS